MNHLRDNLKNIPGWRSPEKLIAFAVDDYGNVCLDSHKARSTLESKELNLAKHIDRVDALETAQDLEMLFDVLNSVRDSVSRPPIFTANTICANPDFPYLVSQGSRYKYEPLPDTFARLSIEQPHAYDDAWNLWKEGIRNRLIRPQFHGREHINVEVFERKLRAADDELMFNLNSKSMVGIGQEESMPGVAFTEAFEVWRKTELDRQREILVDGLSIFESIFGFRSSTVAPPGMKLHPYLYTFLESLGIRGIDKPQRCLRRIDENQLVWEWNTLGVNKGQNHVSIIRNVVFEPTKNRSIDYVATAMRQIEAAFRWRKPAIISSHRANFAGHIEPENRSHGLRELKALLKKIVIQWPDVRFVSVDEIVERILDSI